MSEVIPVVGGIYVSITSLGMGCAVYEVSDDNVSFRTFDVFDLKESGFVSCSRELFGESWKPFLVDGVHQINDEVVDNSDGYGKLREAANHLGLSEVLEKIINLAKDLK